MSASDDIWILGISMTKFGKHADKDVIDLAAEATRGTFVGVTDGLASASQCWARRSTVPVVLATAKPPPPTVSAGVRA